MIIKVCGLKDKAQIEQLDKMDSINWLGTIFYEKSKRFTSFVAGEVSYSKKVGVFVDEEIDQIKEVATQHQLDILQLHGSETMDMCLELRKQYTIIKAFGIDETFDFDLLKGYDGAVDYFLFDTKTSEYGGSGKVFNWDLLQNYLMKIPFLLSGGINQESVNDLLEFKHTAFVGIDINSGFETEPGNKNIEQIEKFVKELKKNQLQADDINKR